MRRTAAGAAIAGICLLASAAPVDAAVSASASCTPTTLVFPGATTLNCTVNVQTGPEIERFTLAARVPRFTGGNSTLGEGPTVGQGGPPVLTGPGKGLIGSITQASTISCSEAGGTHGNFDASYAYSYEIPANTATSFSMRFGAAQAPWPGDSLAPTILLQASAPGGSTLPADIALPIPEPVRLGQSGVRISFNTRPATGGPLSGDPGEFRVGRRIAVIGRTNPAVANQVMRIFVRRAVETKRGRVTTLAKVRTDRRGRFALKNWRPDKAGFFEVGVTYRSQQPDLADDFACSRFFELVK